MTKEQELRLRMISYDGGDPARIQHFIKVYTFAVMMTESFFHHVLTTLEKVRQVLRYSV